jgi:cell division protein FtsZ
MDEIGIINDHIQREAGNTADIIFGVGTDEELGDAISVLVIATGFSKEDRKIAVSSEKIKFSLDDNLNRKNSPFKSREERTDFSAPSSEIENTKSVFRLEEDNLPPPTSFYNTTENQQLAAENTGNEHVVLEDINLGFDNFEKPVEVDLFSYDDSQEEAWEKQSFSFETDEPIAKNPEIIQFQNPRENQEEFIFEKEEPVKEIESIPAFTIKSEEKIVVEETQEVTSETMAVREEVETIPETQSHGEFTFINKSVSQDLKVQERRNKLKEFNSRYQSSENENHFETVPAFKRKNIQIDGLNASDHQVNSFVSEDERGKVQVRENRFLNKDVD